MATTVNFSAVYPEKFKEGALRLSLLNGLRRIGTMITEDMRKPTETWDHKVKFERHPSLAGGFASIEVTTDDSIYAILDKGTSSTTIYPKRKKALRFPGTFQAKTSPGTLVARSGGSSGDYVFSAFAADHKIEAREFVDQVERIWLEEGRFEDELEDLFDEVALETGYSI